MIGLNNLRLTNLGLKQSLERLSSGLRINKGADDPSGLAIAKGMESQIMGIRTSQMNGEDGISLIHTADGALAETHDVLMRMRDLAVRAANEATLTSRDIMRINNELQSLKAELARKSQAVTFNTKVLFSGGYSGTNQQLLQIGPDNGTNYRLTIEIWAMTNSGLFMTSGTRQANWLGGGSLLISNVSAGAATTGTAVGALSMAWTAIDHLNSAINFVSDLRASLGIQERRLGHVIDDLKAQEINVAAAKSRIWDADMASEITEFTRLQILQQSGTAILAQANAQPQNILQLLQ
jgi:flagellin